MGTGGDSQTSFLEKGLDAGHQVVPNLVATKVKDTEQGEEKISRKEVARRGGSNIVRNWKYDRQIITET